MLRRLSILHREENVHFDRLRQI